MSRNEIADQIALATLNGMRVVFTPEHPQGGITAYTGTLWNNPRIAVKNITVDTGAFEFDPNDRNRPDDLQVIEPEVQAVIELDGRAGRVTVREVVDVRDGIIEVLTDGWSLGTIEALDEFED